MLKELWTSPGRFHHSALLCVSVLGAMISLHAGAQTNPPVPMNGELETPYRVELVATRLQAPWSVVFTPDGRIFFSERPGWVRVIEKGQVLPDPALLLTNVAASVKMGLLGMAVDPGFRTNRHMYVAYNYDLGRENYRLRVVRFKEDHNRLVEPHTLIEDIPAYRNHTGCRLLFGPDGYLYITTGDANDPPRAQRLDSLAGKILRLNPDGSIPLDNPFANRSDAHPAIWSYGHRNPQGLDFQPGSGLLFATEHGPDHGDEVNIVTKGANYGWPTIHHRMEAPELRSPFLEFTPAIGPAGTMFYRGNAFPELKGNLLVGCLRGESILRVVLDGTNAIRSERLLHRKYGRIRDVVEGPDGYIYFTTSQFDPPEGTPRPEYDMILRLVPASTRLNGAKIAQEWRDTGPVAPEFDPATREPAPLIAAYCAPCHGPGLKGGMQRGLLSGDWRIAKDDETIRRVLRDGLGDKGMPAFGRTMQPDQMQALLDYIRKNTSTEKTSTPPPTATTPARQEPSPYE